MLKLLPALILFFSSLPLYATNSAITPFNFKEGFEKNANIKYWTSSSKLSKPTIHFSFDEETKTEGKQSLFIDAKITGLPNKQRWYYYLQIPFKELPNLDGNLSFSMDIKVDKESSKHVQVGLNLPYYPVSSGVYTFNQALAVDKWTHIQIPNLSKETLPHAKRWTANNLYQGTIKDVGRGVNRIGILLKGVGDKHLKFHIDNIAMKGTCRENKEFMKNYRGQWQSYLLKQKNEIKTMQENLVPMNNIETSKLSPQNLEKYKITQKYYQNIKKLFNEADTKNHFSPKFMEKIKDQTATYNAYVKSLISNEKISFFELDPYRYYRLTGTNTPDLDPAISYKIRLTPSEYHSIAMLMQTNETSGLFEADIQPFTSDTNFSNSSPNIDLYIAKIWYQAGLDNTLKSGKFLTQELLLKDETLVKVDPVEKANYLKVTDNVSKKERYINISDPASTFPDTNSITFNDSKKLQPFNLDLLRHKILWGIVHVPANTPVGIYNTQLDITNASKKLVKTIPIEIEVLPFDLDASKLTYSLYYHGELDKQAKPIDCFKKSAQQLETELRDMKRHGVLYPTSYDRSAKYLNDVLAIRNKIGLPKDKFYSLGIRTYFNNMNSKLEKFQKILKKHGYPKDALHIYAHDEANPNVLQQEQKQLKKAEKLGVKTFVAGYNYTYQYIGELLNTFIYSRGPLNEDAINQVKNWHSQEHEIFVYGAPQVGVENPEVYRRNFGCKLWKYNFDGAMNYAYQKQYGNIWNDFDRTEVMFRDETFTYPTTNGIIGTIQWEGFRQAINDVRYLSTLENIKNKLERSKQNTRELNEWLATINCNSDLNKLREEIIQKLLIYNQEL